MSGGVGAGQTFTVPANVTHLKSVSLGVTQVGGNPNYTLALYRFSGGVVGAQVETSAQSISGAANFQNYEMDALTLSGAGLAVTPGEMFLIVGSPATPVGAYAAGRADVYPGGTSYRSGLVNPGFDGFFRAEYTDVVVVTVPTMTEWAMILFGLILAGGAAVMIQRRRFTV